MNYWKKCFTNALVVALLAATCLQAQPLTKQERLALKEQRALASKPAFGNWIDHLASSHPGAYHQFVATTDNGKTVELLNGSVWSMHVFDRYKIWHWLTTDLLLIVPNESWFSFYDYRLVNERNGESIEVTLELGPALERNGSYQILSIDHTHHMVYFKDSCWGVSFDDAKMIDRWRPGDSIIIGTNTDEDAAVRPYILINANLDVFVTAAFIN